MERQIGEIFQDGEVTLKVVYYEYKNTECDGCYYSGIGECLVIKCTESERSDNESVMFVKQ